MRFNPNQKLTAAEIINTYSETDLAYVLKVYGEESFYRQIARLILQKRPLRTTAELVQITEQATGGRRGEIHPGDSHFPGPTHRG